MRSYECDRISARAGNIMRVGETVQSIGPVMARPEVYISCKHNCRLCVYVALLKKHEQVTLLTCNE